MGKMNSFEVFLSSEKGQKVFNFLYSWGAAVVIIGAMFKIIHLPFADYVLMAGMITEALVFFVSGFDNSSNGTAEAMGAGILIGGEISGGALVGSNTSSSSETPTGKPQVGGGTGSVVIVGGGIGSTANAGTVGGGSNGGLNTNTGGQVSSGSVVNLGGGGGSANNGGTVGTNTNAGTQVSSNPVVNTGGGGGGSATNGGPVSGGAGGGSAAIISNNNANTQVSSGTVANTGGGVPSSGNAHVGSASSSTGFPAGSGYGVSEQSITPEYAQSLSDTAQNLGDFSNTIQSLNEASRKLLSAYTQITEDQGFVENLTTLNQNVSGLNEVFSTQMQTITEQMSAIRYINDSLLRMKNLYDGAIGDSYMFREESAKMTKHIEALNNVYARLLQAMTNNPSNPNPMNF